MRKGREDKKEEKGEEAEEERRTTLMIKINDVPQGTIGGCYINVRLN